MLRSLPKWAMRIRKGVQDPCVISHSPIWQPSQHRAELIFSHNIDVAYAISMLRGFVPGSPISIVYKQKSGYCAISHKTGLSKMHI